MSRTAAVTQTALEQLYEDALEIYERARAEVTIPRSDGTHQKYAAVRYKQQIGIARFTVLSELLCRRQALTVLFRRPRSISATEET